jgi:hypothetical protein
MSYKHLKVVIEEAKEFEAYLSRLQHGFSSDDVMQTEGARQVAFRFEIYGYPVYRLPIFLRKRGEL